MIPLDCSKSWKHLILYRYRQPLQLLLHNSPRKCFPSGRKAVFCRTLRAFPKWCQLNCWRQIYTNVGMPAQGVTVWLVQPRLCLLKKLPHTAAWHPLSFLLPALTYLDVSILQIWYTSCSHEGSLSSQAKWDELAKLWYLNCLRNTCSLQPRQACLFAVEPSKRLVTSSPFDQ